MSNDTWLDYDSEADSYYLHNFIREYDYDDPTVFQINYNNEEIYYCRLVLSGVFKGLVYISATDEQGNIRNFAVGDDRIVSWKPPYKAPDLMVG